MAESTGKRKRMGIFEFVITSIGLIVGATIIGIVIEWVGMFFWWPDEGATHSMRMVVQEAGYLNRDFLHAGLFGFTPRQVVDWIAIQLTSAPLSTRTLDPRTYSYLSNVHIGSGSESWFNVIKEFLLAGIYITIVCVIRSVIIFFTLPLYGLFMLIAFIDGLMVRDLRRFGGARESGERFDYAKNAVLPSLWGGWSIYLAIPFSVHPNWVLVPSVVFSSLSLWVATRFFKKYL